MHTLMGTSWFTSEHILVITNGALAVAALLTIRSSNRVARAAEVQATETRDAVKAAQDQVKLGGDQLEKEREALDAAVRPVLVDVPDNVGVYFEATDEVLDIEVPFRNIGNGPAFIRDAYLTLGPGSVTDAEPLRTVIPMGENVGIFKRFSANDSMYTALTGQRPLSFSVGVKYSDVGDNQRTQSVIHFSLVRIQKPKAERVELYRCDKNWIREEQPFVQTLVPSP